MEFKEKIDKLMQLNGIKNVRQLANHAMIPYTTLHEYYTNLERRENMSVKNIKKLAKCLGCTTDYLIYDEQDYENEFICQISKLNNEEVTDFANSINKVASLINISKHNKPSSWSRENGRILKTQKTKKYKKE